MSTRLAVAPLQDRRRPAGPAHRAIVAVDLEGIDHAYQPGQGRTPADHV
jgi:hypothetical protein